MGIPAPSFNYDALNARGGLGQGLAALSGSLVEAAARRKQAEVAAQQLDMQKQGLARLQSNDVISQENAKRAALEHGREFDANQQMHEEKMGLERLKYMAPPTAEQQARTEMYHAQADRAKRAPIDMSKDPTFIPAAVWNQLDQANTQEAEAAVAARKLSPEYQKQVADAGAWKMPWSAAAPPPEDLNALRTRLLTEGRHRRGLDRQQPWQTGIGGKAGTMAPKPVDAGPAAPAPSDLHNRVSKAYGGKLPPDVADALARAANGDTDAAQDLEDALNGGSAEPAVAPEEETDLLGNPVRR